ncbi:MAG: class II glutamine amidotransferase [Oscillospiraceae bacterium]
MCELFGITSSKPINPIELLKAFYAHSVRHPHGWGIMYEDNGRKIVKEPHRAYDSKILQSLLPTIPPQKNMLAHIRFATVGRVRMENCHPFVGTDHSGREWTLAHNGTVFTGKFNYQYYKKQDGDTDSERLFMAFIDDMNEHLRKGILSERERFEAVSEFVAKTAPRNKLNLIIYDGDLLYVHKNLQNTLYYKKISSGFVFSTKPLDEMEWIPFPVAQVIAYRDGKQVYRGTRHKGVFIPTLEYISTTDAMNI